MLPVVRSLLDPAALSTVVRDAYGFPVDARCTLLRSLVNEVYEVVAGPRRYVLKVYRHGWRTADEVAWECDLIGHLADRGVPVGQVVPRSDGAPVGTVTAPEGERAVALFAHVDGPKPGLPSNDAVYEEFGRLTAELHAAADSFRSVHIRPVQNLESMLDGSLAAILPWLDGRPDDSDFLAALVTETRDHITALADELDWGVCHGDVTLDNLHVTAAGLTIHDFDLAGEGWRASDLYGVRQTPHWPAFLAGYTSRRPLSEADVRAVDWFVVPRALANISWHLRDFAAWRGTLALQGDYLDNELAALRTAARRAR